MSKKKKKCERMHISGNFLTALFASTIAIGVFASVAHLDALDRIERAEQRLQNIEDMQKKVITFLTGTAQQ